MQTRPSGQGSVSGMQVAVNPAGVETVVRANAAGQSLGMGGIAGVAAAVVGAVLWAAVTYVTEYQIGWMAVGVGLLVGLAVRRFGKGTDATFGILGAALALAGCLAGNLLTVCLVLAREKAMPLLAVLSRLDFGIVVELMKATFSPIDLLFYGIAVYEAYRFSVRTDTGGVTPEKAG